MVVDDKWHSWVNSAEFTAAQVLAAFDRPLAGYEVAMMIQRIWPDLKEAIRLYGEAGHTFKAQPVCID